MNHLKTFDLYDLRSVGQHCLSSARKSGDDTSTPLAFMGAITVAIGCKMMWDAYQKKQGGGIRTPCARTR